MFPVSGEPLAGPNALPGHPSFRLVCDERREDNRECERRSGTAATADRTIRVRLVPYQEVWGQGHRVPVYTALE